MPMRMFSHEPIWTLPNSKNHRRRRISLFPGIAFRFVHLGNIHSECAKLRVRLEESKREVLSRRSSSEQTQLASVLDAMICVR